MGVGGVVDIDFLVRNGTHGSAVAMPRCVSVDSSSVPKRAAAWGQRGRGPRPPSAGRGPLSPLLRRPHLRRTQHSPGRRGLGPRLVRIEPL